MGEHPFCYDLLQVAHRKERLRKKLRDLRQKGMHTCIQAVVKRSWKERMQAQVDMFLKPHEL